MSDLETTSGRDSRGEQHQLWSLSKQHPRIIPCRHHLYLQQLEHQAEKWSWPLVPSKGAANMVQLHGMVHNSLCSEGKTVLLPVRVAIYFAPCDLFDQILRIRPMDL